MNNEQIIWKFLKDKIGNNYGVAGLMGNLYAESGLRPDNLQNSYEKKFGLDDAEYTEHVDNGTYTNFVKDSAGYGLAQWTYWTRKQNLLEYAKNTRRSIGDLQMQLQFLWSELQGYKTVLNTLKTATSVRQASDIVLTQFERPANMGVEVQEKRASYGMNYYNKYCTMGSGRATNQPIKIDCTILSPNCTTPRNHKIDTITIHCMAGNLSVESCGNLFKNPDRQASSNYGIGSDGRIGLYVKEENRSWCTSNRDNDHRAITIEVANDGGAPDWHVSDKALQSLINLCVDICKRNGIKKLIWSTNKNERVNHLNGCNMTVHRDYAAKACPGEYLYNMHGYIADEVNKRL